jgi:ATP-binding cassette, subfamily B, multidrug efflux pump
MHSEYGYAEEAKLGNPYDLAQLRRLSPFVWRYKRLILYAIGLVTLITLVDLSLPYLIKIAIDRHIVPERQLRKMYLKTGGEKAGRLRHIRIPVENSEIERILLAHPELFKRTGGEAVIAYSDYARLSKDELAVINQKDLSGLATISAIFLGVIVLDFLLNFSQLMIMEYTGQKVMHDLRIELYSHIQELSISFFSKNPTGRLVTRVTNDVQNMHDLFTSIVTFFFKDLFLLLGISVVLLAVNWKLALICFTVLPFVVWASLSFSRRAREAFRVLRVKIAEINTLFSESITGIRIIQLFLQEARNYNKFKKVNHQYYMAGMKQVHVFAIFMPVIELLGMTALAIVIIFGGRGVLLETVSLGEIVAFITYMKMFFRPIRDIAEKYNIMQNAMASSERIFLLLDIRDKDGMAGVYGEKAKTNGFPGKIEEVSFKQVSFEYLPDDPVLKDISFTIKAGESIAVVGPTGSGKTSLVHLLLRFYNPVRGKILINDIDVKTMDLSQLRSRIGLVMQDPFLFSDTIEKNITYGNSQILPSDLDRILSASHLREIVADLPLGIATVLNEGGNSLSSGEKQLISIARAFARNPELIIFDEATSYVDSETEIKIQKAMTRLMKGRTSVTVAHRLTTAKTASRILVLNQGRIVEAGSHDELINQKGFYFKLHQIEDLKAMGKPKI